MIAACFAKEFSIYSSDTPLSPTLSPQPPFPVSERASPDLPCPVPQQWWQHSYLYFASWRYLWCHELGVLEVVPGGDHWNTGVYLDSNNWEAHFFPVRIFQLQSIHMPSQIVEVSRAQQVPQQALLTMLKCNKQRAVALHEGVHINPCLESVWLADADLLGSFWWKILCISLV